MSVVEPTEYEIRTRFRVDRTIEGLDAAERRIGQVSGLISGLGRSLTRAVGGAMLGAGAGLGFLTSQIAGLHTEVQNAEMGIGSLVNALTKTDMATSLRAARSVMADLRKDAAAGAGELGDYTSGFQTILGPAMRAGADLQRTRNLNRLALTAGFALRGQEGLRLAPIDVLQALTAGAGERTTPIVNQALQAIGKTNAEFNKLSPEERLKVLEQAFGTFAEAATLMGQSWDAQAATLKDHIKELSREVTKPLAERWSDQLERVNGWLDANHDKLLQIADVVGRQIVGAYDGLLERSGTLATAGAGVVAAGGTARVAGAGAGMLGDLAGLVGGRRGGLRAGAGAARAGAGAAGAGLMSSFALGGVLTLLAGIVGGFVVSMTAAARRYPETLAKVQKFAGAFSLALSEFGDAVLRVLNNPWIAWIGNGFLMWTWGFLGVLGIFVRALAAFLDLMNDKVGASLTIFRSIIALAEGRVGDAKVLAALGRGQLQQADSNFIARIAALTKEPRSTKIAPGTGPDDPPVGTTNNNFNGPINVTIKAERLDDPDVVLSSWEAMFRKVSEFPTGSAAGRLVPKPT